MILNTIFFPLLASFILRTWRQFLFQTFLWQLKEYRTDRMISHLKTAEGKKLLINPLSLLKSVLVAAILLIVVYLYFNSDSPTALTVLLLVLYPVFWIIWLVEAAKSVWLIFSRGWKLPKFTVKIYLILAFCSLSVFFWLFIEDINFFLTYGPFFDRFLTLIVFINIFIANIPALLMKKIMITLAKRKINNRKDLLVIGITGSYGRTSTKEFLSSILAKKFKVLKTEEYNNTEIAVAKTILSQLNPKHEIFVVEMGAYKKGEIKAICRLVKPGIGIITGINSQHLDLFGSMDKTVSAKFELIQGLRHGGTAIFNMNNSFVRNMYRIAKNQRKDLKIIGFRKGKTYTVKKLTPYDMSFNLIFGPKKIFCRAQLYGKQNLENIAGAALAAYDTKMSAIEIGKAINQLKPPVHTMRLFFSSKGRPVVDDTFNSNPDGIAAALDYMALLKGKKYLVLTPLIELGLQAKKIHQEIGAKAATIFDGLYVTNSNFFDDIISGWVFGGGSSKDVKLIGNGAIPDRGAIPYEGKESLKILETIC